MSNIWFVGWLRRNAIEELRAEHIADHSFAVGDYVVREWCSLCGQPGHYGRIIKLRRRKGGKTQATIRLSCQAEPVTVGTRLLKKVLPPYPKEVVEMRAAAKRKSTNNNVAAEE
jgi:hypothetical protein